MIWSRSASDEQAKEMALSMGMADELDQEKSDDAGDDNEAIDDGMMMFLWMNGD